MLQFLEIGSVVFSLIFIFLIIKQQPIGWLFGILASVLGVIYFFEIHFVSSAWLNIVYALAGFYGWYNWNRPGEQPIKPHFTWQVHAAVIVPGLCLSLILGYIFTKLPDIQHPYTDALLAVFSVGATVMEARKQLSCWYYWIIVNACYTILYFLAGSYIYAGLSLLFTAISVRGFFAWTIQYKESRI